MADAKDIFLDYTEMDTRVKGSTETPIASGLIAIASATLGRDLRAEERTPDTLGKENLRRIINDKYKSRVKETGNNNEIHVPF